MAFVQASATAVFRSSTRSAGKFIAAATDAAKSIATFSQPRTLGTCSSNFFSNIGSPLCSAPTWLRHSCDDDRDVVVLFGPAHEARDVVEELVQQRRRGEPPAFADRGEQAVESKELARGVHGLDDAVRVEDNDAAVGEGERRRAIIAVGHDAEREGVAVGLDERRLAAGLDEDWLRLSGIRQGQ